MLSLICLGLVNKATARESSPPYIKYVDEVRSQFVKEMRKFGFHCNASGGGMPYDVCKLDLMFSITKKGSIEEAREKIIFITEKFLEAINNHEGIRPYLRDYPFPESRVSISLSFDRPDHLSYTDGSVAMVIVGRSKIFYSAKFSEEEKYVDIFEEKYPEALEKLTNKKDAPIFITASAPPQSTPKPIKEEKKIILTKRRLGTLITDLKGFTPGRELEALGIQNPAGQPEFASDLGELIGGICDEYFGEAFLEELAIWAIEHPNEEYIDYWDNGQMKVKILYKNGWAEGHVHGWYESGNTAFKAYYKNGKRVGIQLAAFPTKYSSDFLGRVLCYDMQGRLDGRQKTSSTYVGLNLLAIARFKHGILHGKTGFYSGKRGGDDYGEWDYKDGKIKKVIKPPVSLSH